MTTEPAKIRGLTRRGYNIDLKSVWSEEAAPEDSAPKSPPPDVAEPSRWGRTPAEARALLLQRVCPVCGEGPWNSPLNHASKKHGIASRDMREACGLTSVKRLTSDECHENFRSRSQLITAESAAAISGKRRNVARRRWTTAGLARVIANLPNGEARV